MLNKEDSKAARELIIEILVPNETKTAKDIAIVLGITGRSVGQLLRELVAKGKVVKRELTSNRVGYTSKRKKIGLPAENNFKLGERFLIVWKEDNIWKADVVPNNEAGLKRATILAGNMPGTVVLCGKADHRVFTPKPKVQIENL